jgi:hypothetical protein
MLMRARSSWMATVVASICLFSVVSGCGGGSSSTQGSAETAGAEPSTQFLKPHSKYKNLVKFGHEASAEVREEAGAVVAESLEARAAADFNAQCATLSMKVIAKLPDAKTRRDCAAALKEVAEPLPSTKEYREDTLSGSITAMRVKGDLGYVLYHGSDGKDYIVPMEKEAGTWKVGSLTNTAT